MLSLYKLEIFASVIQEGSFSAAAKRLPMTQPAVSQHIQDLETTLGTQLFNRNRRGAVLTPAGEILYEYTQRILALVTEAESAVTTVDNLVGGQTSLMVTPGIGVYLMPEWISLFRTQYPNLGITLMTGVTTDVLDAVLAHTVDMGFVEGELDGLVEESIGRCLLRDVTMCLVISKHHEWAGIPSISIDMLSNQSFITRQPFSRTRIWTDRLLTNAQVKPRIVGEFDNPESIKQAILANVGVALLPDYAVKYEIEAGLLYAVELDGYDLKRQITLLWNKSRPFTPIARALLQNLQTRFPMISKVLV
jgi:DNA-binding transcriptional LysR family regulator